MSLTRKLLSALGIEPDKQEQIIDAHSETVSALKEQIAEAEKTAAGYKADAEKYKKDADTIPELQKKIKDMEDAAKGTEDYKAKYEAEHADFEAYKTKQAEAENAAKIQTAYRRDVLAKTGIPEKRYDAVLRLSDLSKIELDKDGNVKGADELVSAAKTDWAEYIPTEQTKGADVPTPPSNAGGKMSKEDIMKINDPIERQAKIAENKELFGL